MSNEMNSATSAGAAHNGDTPDASVISTYAIRSQFPALERFDHGWPVAYFDGPGGTQVPTSVADAVSGYMLNHNANTHWSYTTSRETDAMIAAARSALADMLGGSAGEISFGANMTTLLFHIARAIGRQLGPGDEIVVTEMDHHANIAPWQAVARERGAVLRWVPFNSATWRHREGAFGEIINSRTRVVAVGAASNALGTITDVRPVVELARSVGAISVVDAVHYAPHSLVDASGIGCDFLLCSAYKFHGPHLGVVYGRHDAIAALDVPKLEPAPDGVPERLETGTQNHEGIAGAAAAVNFLASLCTDDTLSRRERLVRTFDELHRRSRELVSLMWQSLGDIPGVHLYGLVPGESRTPTVAFRVEGIASEAVTRLLVKRGVYVSHGDFYATTVVRQLGLADEGLVRAGCACYTTAVEVTRLATAVHDAASGKLS